MEIQASGFIPAVIRGDRAEDKASIKRLSLFFLIKSMEDSKEGPEATSNTGAVPGSMVQEFCSR